MKLSTFADLCFVMLLLLLLPASEPRARTVHENGNRREVRYGETRAELHVALTDVEVHWYADKSYSVEAVLPKGSIVMPLGCATTSLEEGLVVETWAKVAEFRYVLMKRESKGFVQTYVTGDCE